MIGLPDVRSLKINEVAKTSGANRRRLLLECPSKTVKTVETHNFIFLQKLPV
jgi:hypothetical protein